MSSIISANGYNLAFLPVLTNVDAMGVLESYSRKPCVNRTIRQVYYITARYIILEVD